MYRVIKASADTIRLEDVQNNDYAFEAMLKFKDAAERRAERKFGECYSGDCSIIDATTSDGSTYCLSCKATFECEDGDVEAAGTICVDLDTGRTSKLTVKL